MSDRRATNRVPLQMRVSHILSEDRQCPCLTDDLSVNGMRLSRVCGGEWGQPRYVWLQFELPGDNHRAIRALGELRHQQHAEISDYASTRGFRFKYINPRDRRRYEDFVRRSMDLTGNEPTAATRFA